jgi:3-methyl-2-oxobutanoate hydroxymethyltransferase
MKGEKKMEKEEMNRMYSPFPKMSMGQKGRKTIHYLQKLKDEGIHIVQHCPSMMGPLFTMAAEMAGVDICRLTPSFNGRIPPEEALSHAMEWIGQNRSVAPHIHINYVTDTIAFASKEAALANFSKFHMAGADSILPMGINNETLEYVANNYVIVYGHVGAISGWQTMGTFGGYKHLGKTSEDAMKVFRQAYEYQECGMKAMSIELTPIEVSNAIAKKLRVPVISIAAGGACDGSEMVDADLFGLMANPASHAKTYSYFLKFAAETYGAWANDVRTGAYPEDKHGFHMEERELDKFLNELEQKY